MFCWRPHFISSIPELRFSYIWLPGLCYWENWASGIPFLAPFPRSSPSFGQVRGVSFPKLFRHFFKKTRWQSEWGFAHQWPLTDEQKVFLKTRTYAKICMCRFFECLFLFLKEKERERGAEGKWDKGSKAGSVLIAASLMRGLNSQTGRSWPEPKSDSRPTEPPRRPCTCKLIDL